MRAFSLSRCAMVCSLVLMLIFLSSPSERAWAQTTQDCLQCHKGASWPDNNAKNSATSDYLPLNLTSAKIQPFYDIKDAYNRSMHATPPYDLEATDFIGCLGCHRSMNDAHKKKIVGTSQCTVCHNPPAFDVTAFQATAHFNSNSDPAKFFDQLGSGSGQAVAYMTLEDELAAVESLTAEPVLGQPVSLFKADKKTKVTKSNRLQECGVCHEYILQDPRYKSKFSKPQVGCPACHDAHIPAPSGKDIPVVGSTVKVTDSFTSASGSVTVFAVEPATGRSMPYLNLKPYKQDATTGAQSDSGSWTRGSSFTRPNSIIVQGTGTIGNIPDDGGGTAKQFTATGIGTRAKVHYTLFISGVATGTATIDDPAAVSPGDVTVRATLDKAGFGIANIIDDNTVELDPAVIATATVTYRKTPSGTGTKSVPITFSGDVTFELRNMQTNTETLCSSCHAWGKYKFSAWGKTQEGDFIDVAQTHNSDVSAQYASSGHANILALAFDEFSARPYGTSHVTTYPFDMSITGSGANDSLRNKGNTLFELTVTPNVNNDYLSRPGKTSLPQLVNNYACFQCHHGLGTIDYLKDRQGTSDAQVLWGDANVTCLTCHDTHDVGAGANVRIPVKLSYNSRFVSSSNPGGGINKFMDGTAIPANVGEGIICLFCHQGRESGLTVYQAIAAKGVNPYTNPTQVIDAVNGISFINPHYLDSGAVLWGRNAWEYILTGGTVPQQYSTGVTAHQILNCTGCHMAEPNADNTEGGHTWKPRVETCQECHGSFITEFKDVPAIGDYDGDGQVKTAFEEIGTITPRGGDALGSTGTGLFGQLVAALETANIFYNPDSYPYFFDATGGQYKAWTSNQLTAAFNLSWAFKSGTDCVAYHNVYYAAQILQDSLKAMGVDTSGYFRPPIGLRNATDYRTIVVN